MDTVALILGTAFCTLVAVAAWAVWYFRDVYR